MRWLLESTLEWGLVARVTNHVTGGFALSAPWPLGRDEGLEVEFRHLWPVMWWIMPTWWSPYKNSEGWIWRASGLVNMRRSGENRGTPREHGSSTLFFHILTDMPLPRGCYRYTLLTLWCSINKMFLGVLWATLAKSSNPRWGLLDPLIYCQLVRSTGHKLDL